jgi:hypothetical protein
MKALFIPTVFAALCGLAQPAFADIPTIDAAQLTQHAETAGNKVKLAPVTTQRQNAHNGVKCAVTTGKKANVADPTVQPQAGAGAKTIQPYAPDLPAAPQAGAQGAALNSQTLFKSTGDVVAGLDASRSTLGAAQGALQAAGAQVGAAPTVMGALDMNSAARLQNALAWNGAIGSANLWVTALNALNLAVTSDMSRAAIGMRAAAPQTTSPGAPLCPAGMIGSGTLADPCRASSCSTTPAGTPADPACVSARVFDASGDVLMFLASVQSAATAAATAAAQSSAR